MNERLRRQLPAKRQTLLHPYLLAGLLVLLVVGNATGSITGQLWPVVVAAIGGTICIIECRLAGFSWAHPRILIMGYVVVACSIPPIYADLQPDSRFARTFENVYFWLSPETPLLMALTILATGVGLSLAKYAPRQVAAPPDNDSPHHHDSAIAARYQFARVLLIVASLSTFFEGLTLGASRRGINQVDFGIENALFNFRQFALTAAVVVVYSSRLQLRWSAGKSTLDHVMVALAMVGYLRIGVRSPVIALVLVLFVLRQPRKETKLRNILLTTSAGMILFSWIALYRSRAPGKQDDPLTLVGVWDAFVTDLSSVAGTTGVVHSLVPATEPFTMGATFLADMVRLLPSPIAIALFGQPTNTGMFKFRQLLQFDNPDNGLGFSLPAAGYLDFGVIGLISIMVLCGWVLALLWRHFDPFRSDASSLAYLLIAANFPVFLRSDLLGLLKGVLYPLVIVWIIIQSAEYVKDHRDQHIQRISNSSQLRV